MALHDTTSRDSYFQIGLLTQNFPSITNEKICGNLAVTSRKTEPSQLGSSPASLSSTVNLENIYHLPKENKKSYSTLWGELSSSDTPAGSSIKSSTFEEDQGTSELRDSFSSRSKVLFLVATDVWCTNSFLLSDAMMRRTEESLAQLFDLGFIRGR